MNRISMNEDANQLMIWVIRLIHSLIALTFFTAIGVIYFSAISETYNLWLYLALGGLLVEGITVILNGGNCPLLYLARKYGDDKTFLELFLPKNAAKQMFKVFTIIISIGCLLLLLKFLF